MKVWLDIPLGLHDVQFPRISELSATHEDYKVVKPAHWPPLTPPQNIPGTHLLVADSIPGSTVQLA